MTDWPSFDEALRASSAPKKVTVSVRTRRAAIENALMRYTRRELEIVLADELQMAWMHDDSPSDPAYSKRALIDAYTPGWTLPQLVGLARRLAESDVATDGLTDLLAEYDKRGGVGAQVKNLIFAANGPKPELVLRDAVSNDVEIVKNAEYCLVFDQDIPADGVTFRHLTEWWREREGLPGEPDRDVGLKLHARLLASMAGNDAEQRIFETYARRYRQHGFDIPALIPQVYLHYDPYTLLVRGAGNRPLPRQRMDFLLLFSDRHRVVLELDGKQHYADPDGRANATLYAQMVAEDRRLRLAGYEVYRFGGSELASPEAETMLSAFFDELQQRMK